MADGAKAIVSGDTGKVESVPEESYARAVETGSREATKDEVAKSVKDAENRNNFNPAGMWAAGQHAWMRGVGEAFGVPVDSAATGIASIFGDDAAKSTREFLKGLDEAHPIASGWMGGMGNVHGAVGAIELAKAPGSLSAGVVPRTTTGVASRMGVGGLQNVIQATTHDLNEASLGDSGINGEKIYASLQRAPTRFAVGAGTVGLLEGGGAALGALSRRAIPLAEREASKALGREVGESGTGAVSAGERIRALGATSGRELPRNSNELVDVLQGERAALQGKAQGAYASKLDALAGEHAGEAAQLSIRQEAGRKAGALAGKDALESMNLAAGTDLQQAMHDAGRTVDQTIEHYAALKQSVVQEHQSAMGLVSQIAGERRANALELGKALETMSKKGVPAGKLTKAQFDEMVDTYLGVTGHRGDPATRWSAEEFLRKTYANEMADAAGMASEGTAQHVERLQGLAGDLEAAHKSALDHVRQIEDASHVLQAQAERDIAAAGRLADRGVAKSQKEIAREVATTKKGVETSAKEFERAATKETGDLAKRQAMAEKAVPKPNGKTEIDPWLNAATQRGNAAAGAPAVSGVGAMGAFMSAIHGNPLGSVAALASSFAAGRARAQGNFLLARSLRGVSGALTAVDKAIQGGAASLVGVGIGAAAHPSTKEEKASPAPAPTKFEDVSQRIIAARANPMLIHQDVQGSIGHLAGDAPQTYASVLAAAQRANEFLASVLPQPQRDAHSLTPHLDKGDVPESQKYDFMQYVKTIQDPISVFDAIRDGSATELQVEAIQAVFPALFRQMQVETLRQIATLQKPLDYQRNVHIGLLLQTPTDDVLEDGFQQTQAQVFEKRAQAEIAPANGSGPKGPSSRFSKTAMSGSEQVERGEM